MHRTGSPLAYSGDDLDRVERVGTPYVLDRYGADQSGAVRYRFNRLGFRGAEYQPSASCLVFVFGESQAFGVGVDERDLWHARVARGWAAARGLHPDDVCVVNFAEEGASNGYVARAVLTQCAQCPPDLVLIQFAAPGRAEACVAGRAARVGPWMNEPRLAAWTRSRAHPPEKRRHLQELLRRGQAFLRYTSPATGALDSLLNMLLAQSFCQARGLPAIAVADRIERIRARAAEAAETCGPLLELLDPEFLAEVAMPLPDDDADRAADGRHASAAQHAALADALLDWIARRAPRARPVRTSGRCPGADPDRAGTGAGGPT